MRRNETINGYKVLTEPQLQGQSVWAFARKEGEEYFLKQFLNPRYPLEGAPGSRDTIRKKRQQCDRFEQHHQTLKKALAGRVLRGGNLIYTLEFFREGTLYYKVTEKIDTLSFDVKAISALSRHDRILILRTCAHSVGTLHQLGIIHGDLKPENILIKNTMSGEYVAKLIDFDNSYFAGHPPLVDMVGDQVYYSPELFAYFTVPDTLAVEQLQLKSDIFSLGLIFAEYLTGRLPTFDERKFRYPCEAVHGGKRLVVDGRNLPVDLSELVNRMLAKDPRNRPTISGVFATLKGEKIVGPGDSWEHGETPDDEGSLVSSMLDTSTSERERRNKPKLISKLLNPGN